MFQQIKNWGRWGANDQLGSANLLTDDTRKRAIKLARTGQSVSLSHPLMTDKADDNASPFEHTMIGANTMDTYRVSYHGYAHSHIDGLCHILYKGRPTTATRRADVNTPTGCAKLGIDNLKQGVITRGILIDIPRLRGLPYLEPGTPVYVEDLEAWEKKAGIKIGPGDAILLRTGRWARREKVGPWAVGRNAAGFHASVAPWIKARGVAFVGSDAAQDVVPSMVEGMALPVHTLLLTGLGINLLDNQDLEARRGDGGQAQSMGVHADHRAAGRHGRNRIAGQHPRDVLMTAAVLAIVRRCRRGGRLPASRLHNREAAAAEDRQVRRAGCVRAAVSRARADRVPW